MGILFKDIYTKAIALFDDPKVTVAYKTNMVQFEKIMYTYLQNAIGLFHNPASIGMRLANYTEPYGMLETFEGDGETNSFVIDDSIIVDANKEYDYVFTENNTFVKGSFDKDSRTVTFPDVLPEGQEYSFELYYCGEFNDNFDSYHETTKVSDGMVTVQIKDILARLVAKAWAESERGVLLDIRGILQDTDFKLTDSSKLLTAKNAWIDQLDTETFQMQNRLAWSIRFTQSTTRLGRG